MILNNHDLHPDNYQSRSQGLLSREFRRRHVVAVGLGGGSYMVEKLARMGPAQLTLVDFDVVEAGNLGRTGFDVADLGRPKADALADHIRRANPFVEVVPLVADICRMSNNQLSQIFGSADLIIAGTDRFSAQLFLNRWSVQTGVPAVFIGVHAGAAGGRIIWSVPGLTPCYVCVAYERYVRLSEQDSAVVDLQAAQGLLVDIQFIDMVALKICTAILERSQASAMGDFFRRMGRRNDVIVRTSPGYEYGADLWEALLADLPTKPKAYAQELREQALFAMDTVWLASEYEPTCPACGHLQHREV